MKKYVFLLTILITTALHAQQIGQWTVYSAYHNANRNIPIGNLIYSLCDGSIFTYSPDDTEIRALNKAGGLSDCDISFISYNKTQKSLLLVYSNQNIDLLSENGAIYNLPQYKNSTQANKSINDVNINGNYGFLATDFGIIQLDMKRIEFSNTYTLNMKVNSVVLYNDNIWVTTANGLYKGKVTDNLYDPESWHCINATFSPKKLTVFNQQLVALSSDGLYKINTNGTTTVLQKGIFKYINAEGSMMILGGENKDYIYETIDSYKEITHEKSFQWLSYSNGIYWASQGMDGLKAYKLDNQNTLKPSGDGIIPNSPVRNYCYFLRFDNERNKLLVAGGNLNYVGKNYEGTLMQLKDGIWTNFSEENIYEETHLPYRNLTSIIQAPDENGKTNHFFATSAGMGMYEFKDFKFVKLYDDENSTLESIYKNHSETKVYIRCDGLNYDKEGNLWMTNTQVDSVVKIRMNNGQWKSLYIDKLKGYPTMEKLMFDSKGRVWIISKRTVEDFKSGVYCLDYNGTITNRKDDKENFITSINNQDGIKYVSNTMYAIAEDKNGQIWIGSDQGPFLISNTDDFLNNSNFNYTQIKIPRNDGTNYADYLLNGTPITAISIDGGNRKWLGTDGYGVYLLSPDGQQTIHHFTSENSPLLSNIINSIAVNGQTGEVYFGTEKGLVSYMSDATEPAESLEENNIKVYPNPVRPEYEGPISITGFTTDCDIKITTQGGQVIYAGTSSGGTFTWNGKNQRGQRVATGVYYVLASDSEGKKGVAARILMVK